jgi:hydrogenase 3 maturation protease
VRNLYNPELQNTELEKRINRPGVVPENFERTLRDRFVGRIAVMGIGNTMRGDDGLAVHLVNSVRQSSLSPNVGLFVCEMTPENFVGPVTEFQPDTILMIDAAELGEPPGSVHLVDAQDIADSGMTTHTLSLRLLATVLESATNAEVALLAVQPKRRDFGAEISPEVSETLDYLTQLVHAIIHRKA